MRILTSARSDGTHTWWLYGGDGVPLAWAGRTYATDVAARQGARAFLRSAARARVEITTDRFGHALWVAHDRHDEQVAVAAEARPTTDRAWAAWRAVRAAVLGARVA